MATKGPSVDLPLGQLAPVRDSGSTALADLAAAKFRNRVTGAVASAGLMTSDANGIPRSNASGYAAGGSNVYDLSLVADLSDATAATINQLRQAFQIQKLYERDARGGTRYTEIIKSHFGVTSPDARLQRPEYLGGGTTPINVNPIAQTSSSDNTSPQGNLPLWVLCPCLVMASRSLSRSTALSSVWCLCVLTSHINRASTACSVVLLVGTSTGPLSPPW